MTRPRLLDLFCGAGGASVGYARAGFDVVGVDVVDQPHYPFDFVKADALDLLTHWRRFELAGYRVAAIHASPPCQAYIKGTGNVAADGRHPRMIAPVRAALGDVGLPYVIENVPGATIRADVVLCGSMFGLAVRRHRWFETSWPVAPWTFACRHDLPITGVYGHPHGASGAWPGMLAGNVATWSTAMGIDWMTSAELAVAIPPAYTEWIGRHLLEHIARGGEQLALEVVG